jgi:FkbM family methyltransferase
MTPAPYTPQYTVEERIKYNLIPRRLYMWRLMRKHARQGQQELKLLPQLVTRDKIAIDIGANKGVYAHALSALCLEVRAFEPHPKMFAVLNHGLPPNVRTHRIALSDADGTAELVIPSYNKAGFSNQGASLDATKKSAPFGYASVAVDTRRLDSFRFTNIGFIKIDVEGFEAAVVRGALDTIRREKPVLMIEIEEWHRKRPIEECLQEMDVLNAEAFFILGGTLRPIADFDPDAHHRGRRGKPGYVQNFVFKPH